MSKLSYGKIIKTMLFIFFHFSKNKHESEPNRFVISSMVGQKSFVSKFIILNHLKTKEFITNLMGGSLYIIFSSFLNVRTSKFFNKNGRGGWSNLVNIGYNRGNRRLINVTLEQPLIIIIMIHTV